MTGRVITVLLSLNESITAHTNVLRYLAYMPGQTASQGPTHLLIKMSEMMEYQRRGMYKGYKRAKSGQRKKERRAKGREREY